MFSRRSRCSSTTVWCGQSSDQTASRALRCLRRFASTPWSSWSLQANRTRPDALTPVGGYPGNDERGAELQRGLDGNKIFEDFVAAAQLLAKHPDSLGRVGAEVGALDAAVEHPQLHLEVVDEVVDTFPGKGSHARLVHEALCAEARIQRIGVHGHFRCCLPSLPSEFVGLRSVAPAEAQLAQFGKRAQEHGDVRPRLAPGPDDRGN